MNWMMLKKTIMNTESKRTIPPPVGTMMMTSDCQLMNRIDAVATQAQQSRQELTQISSR
jgi:hypothetical protein